MPSSPSAPDPSALRSPSRRVGIPRPGRSDQPTRRSTGPRTPEGKARSSLNALKHGLSARPDNFLRRSTLTERNLLRRLLQDLVIAFQPTNPAERLLVERMTLAQLRLARCRRVETALFERVRPVHARLDEDLPPDVALLLRYESAAERTLYRSLAALLRLRRLRLGTPPPLPPVAAGAGAQGLEDPPVQNELPKTAPLPPRDAIPAPDHPGAFDPYSTPNDP